MNKKYQLKLEVESDEKIMIIDALKHAIKEIENNFTVIDLSNETNEGFAELKEREK